jgi:hypothetical protein
VEPNSLSPLRPESLAGTRVVMTLGCKADMPSISTVSQRRLPHYLALL